MAAPDPDPSRNGWRNVSPGRITTWIVVGGIGVFLVVSGVLGIIAKG